MKGLFKDINGLYSSRLVYAPIVLIMAFILAYADKSDAVVGIFMTSFTTCVGLSVVDKKKE